MLRDCRSRLPEEGGINCGDSLLWLTPPYDTRPGLRVGPEGCNGIIIGVRRRGEVTCGGTRTTPSALPKVGIKSSSDYFHSLPGLNL